jgi:ABC-type nitrate/sulfonate/bicarbonate transport system substrate-binding protein
MTSILALKSGAIQAAALNGDEALLAEKEGLRTLAFIGDLFPYPFQGFLTTDKKIAEKPADIKRWVRAMMRALMFIRERPEEAADIALAKIPMGNTSRPLVLEGIKRFAKALPDGIPGVPSAQGLTNVIEFDVKAPLKIKDEIAPEKFLYLKLANEVKEELERKR